jgi:GTP cyclohydrolase I
VTSVDQLSQDPGDSRAHSLDGRQVALAVQLVEVGTLQRQRPCGHRKGFGAEDFLWILPQEISDLGQRLRGSDRIHELNCVRMLDMATPKVKAEDPVAELVESLLVEIGEDPDRQGLKATPDRVSRALRELTDGYGVKPEDVIADAIFDQDYDEMVVVKNINFYSLCEHHMLPFFGQCHVGYLPKGKIVGLSKIPRLVEVFSHRLQIQEQLTKQVAEALNDALDPHGVGVVVEARHLCMEMRGVELPGGRMLTSCMLGTFRRDSRTRAEFLDLVRRS